MTRDTINPELAKIAFALGFHRWPLLRRIALTIATRQMWELHENGHFQAGAAYLGKICRRFRLGDYREACRQHLKNF